VLAKPVPSRGLERDAERLYDLIWRQFVACQMPDAEYVSTSLVVVQVIMSCVLVVVF
jgi:DNA topoisomerase-1